MKTLFRTSVVSSRHPLNYSKNRNFLTNGLQGNIIHFQDFNYYLHPAVVYNKRRLYDFTRTAKAQVRENMTAYLCSVLPGLTRQDKENIRVVFDCLFGYYGYKGNLDVLGQQHESLEMLVFDRNKQYVAHVQFNNTTVISDVHQFTVCPILTCHRYTYFEPALAAVLTDPVQAVPLPVLIAALQKLCVAQ